MISLIFLNFTFSVLPEGCWTVQGPYPLECLRSMWREGGCLNEGVAHPENLNKAELGLFDSLNIL